MACGAGDHRDVADGFTFPRIMETAPPIPYRLTRVFGHRSALVGERVEIVWEPVGQFDAVFSHPNVLTGVLGRLSS